jgi:phosphoribosylanthranilate isomerase
MTKVKICGITNMDALHAAIDAGADMIGFVFYPPSPRHLEDDAAIQLARQCPPHIERIALLVDPDNDRVERCLAGTNPHRIQLHGKETPERATEIAQLSNRPIIKAFGIGTQSDFLPCGAYTGIADWYLFDAKPQQRELPGGNGKVFDWSLLDAYEGNRPWMLSGGLTVDNVQQAIAQTGATMVDVSSGVEDAPGQKSPDLMRRFIANAKATA